MFVEWLGDQYPKHMLISKMRQAAKENRATEIVFTVAN
jgi:hypothetical protein